MLAFRRARVLAFRRASERRVCSPPVCEQMHLLHFARGPADRHLGPCGGEALRSRAHRILWYLSPSFAFSHLLPPSLDFSCLLSPSLNFSRLIPPSLAFSRPPPPPLTFSPPCCHMAHHQASLSRCRSPRRSHSVTRCVISRRLPPSPAFSRLLSSPLAFSDLPWPSLTFTFRGKATGVALNDVASLHNLVTVVDAASVFEQLTTVDTLADRGWHDVEGDQRTVAHLLCDQVDTR